MNHGDRKASKQYDIDTNKDCHDDENDGDNDEEEWEDIDEIEIDEDSEAILPSTCLFCQHESTSLEDNLHHMTKSHSFFIPDIDYITELESLILYLGSKVGDGKICLYCNKRSRTFPSIDAVQKHMRDKGHTKLDYEGESALEYADFYDFSSSYPDFHQRDMENEELTSAPGKHNIVFVHLITLVILILVLFEHLIISARRDTLVSLLISLLNLLHRFSYSLVFTSFVPCY